MEKNKSRIDLIHTKSKRNVKLTRMLSKNRHTHLFFMDDITYIIHHRTSYSRLRKTIIYSSLNQEIDFQPIKQV